MLKRFFLALWTNLFLRIFLLFLAMFVAGCFAHALVDRLAASRHTGYRGAVQNDNAKVKMLTRRDGEVTHVIIENLEYTEVTMTLDFSVVNLKSSVELPYTATFAPGDTEAFTLSPTDAEAGWQYSYTNYYKLGSTLAVPDSTVYLLPYAPGSTFRVSQGYDGSFSHKGSNRYAIDWKMPEGTLVRAARGGVVVKSKDDSDKGGSSADYDKFNNYVLIRHADGTLGHYCHLKKNGVKVTPGQTVKAGDVIALSGNTGFSSGAHLHFCVFKTKNGRERISIPVKFKDESGEPVTLVEGHKYKAPTYPTAAIAAGAPTSVVK
jgi:murein DD-endopeptidase MepM/ murein hydrolase activator NlpD